MYSVKVVGESRTGRQQRPAEQNKANGHSTYNMLDLSPTEQLIETSSYLSLVLEDLLPTAGVVISSHVSRLAHTFDNFEIVCGARGKSA